MIPRAAERLKWGQPAAIETLLRTAGDTKDAVIPAPEFHRGGPPDRSPSFCRLSAFALLLLLQLHGTRSLYCAHLVFLSGEEVVGVGEKGPHGSTEAPNYLLEIRSPLPGWNTTFRRNCEEIFFSSPANILFHSSLWISRAIKLRCELS
jgi:hypothetical protein